MWEKKVTEIKEHDDLLTGISPSLDSCVIFAQSNQKHICHRMAPCQLSPITAVIPFVMCLVGMTRCKSVQVCIISRIHINCTLTERNRKGCMMCAISTQTQEVWRCFCERSTGTSCVNYIIHASDCVQHHMHGLEAGAIHLAGGCCPFSDPDGPAFHPNHLHRYTCFEGSVSSIHL